MTFPISLDAATREKFRRDPHRPTYHFLPPQHWINDPNGLIQWKGTYHLFYQHNPLEAKWGPMYWGHAVSTDLVHWEHRPIALEPTPNSPDEDGCWSGCAVNDNGIPTIIYSGNRRSGGSGNNAGGNNAGGNNAVYEQRCCLATSPDDLQSLVKYAGNPVIARLPAGYDVAQYRDHCVWHDGVRWNQLIGASLRGQGGAVFLYQSAELLRWELIGPILVGDLERSNPLWSGTMWECPDLIPLGEKHALVISAYAPDELPGFTGYFLGEYHEGRFIPESFQKMDLGDREFYAAQSFVNDDGERIQFGWLGETRPEADCLKAGWAGTLSLPRLLTLRPDGRLGVEPHPAVETLRGAGRRFEGLTVDSTVLDLDLSGAALELHAVFAVEPPETSAARFGLQVFAAPDDSEVTEIAFDRRSGEIAVLRERSSRSAGCAKDPKGGRAPLKPGDDLDLRIFLDHSVIEVYVNGQVAITSRVYPTSPLARQVRLFAEDGRCQVKRLEGWFVINDLLVP